MRLEQSFDVPAPVDRVWQALIDVEQFAPLLPGAAVTGRNEDGSYNGTFTVKIGPTTAAYNGKLELQEIDEAARTAKMHAHGADKRGQGGATATIVSTISSANGGTRVVVVTDYHITGRLARFGRSGMIQDISERLLREFARRLQESLRGDQGAPAKGAEAAEAQGPDLEPDVGADARVVSDADATVVAIAASPPAIAAAPPQLSEPVKGISLASSVVWARTRRKPAPVAFVLGLLLALLVMARRRRSGR